MPTNKDKYKTTITLRNDSVQMVGSTGAYYSQNNDEILIKKGDMSLSDFGFKNTPPEKDEDITIIHERQHQINAHRGVGKSNMSLNEDYQRQVHNEITALIAEKLEIRRQYKACKTDAEKEAFFKKFSQDADNIEYIQAIKNGRINPNSTSSKDFEEEMAFIKNSSIHYRADPNDDGYRKSWTNNSLTFLHERGEAVQSNPEALKKEVSAMYSNIGGFDFNTVGSKDIHVLENQTIIAADNMLQQGAKPQKLLRFIAQGEGDFKLAESLDVTGLNREQAEKVLQTAIVTQSLAENVAGDLAMGTEASYDFDFVARNCREKTAVYLDLKSDIWEKNGTLTTEGDEAKFNELMKKAKEIQLDPEAWYNQMKDLIRSDKFSQQEIEENVKKLQGKQINFDDVVTNSEDYKLPLDGTSKENVIAEMDKKEAEDEAFWKEYYEKHPPEKPRISEEYKKEIMDLDSDILKDELAERKAEEERIRKEEEERKRKEEEERKRKEEEERKGKENDGKQQNSDSASGNTPQDAPQTSNDITIRPRPYADKKIKAPILVHTDSNQPILLTPQYEKAEIKISENENGQQSLLTTLDGKKHGVEFTTDKDGNPQIKLYDQGQEINPEGLKIDIRTDTKDNMIYNYALLNGHVFGTELMTDEKGNMTVAFYDASGQRIKEAVSSQISVTKELAQAPVEKNEQLKQDLAMQKGEEQKPSPEQIVQDWRYDRIWKAREEAQQSHGTQPTIPLAPEKPKEKKKQSFTPIWQSNSRNE